MSGPVAVDRLEDPFTFARSGGLRSGEVPVAALQRIHDRLATNAGLVSYVVRGGQDLRLRPLLELEVSGTPRLRCDRCLAPLDYPLKLQSKVLLATPGMAQPEDDDPESPEWVEAGAELDLLELVEEEILLGLPLSVRHAPGDCSSDDVSRIGRRDSPFSGLAALLDPKPTLKD